MALYNYMALIVVELVKLASLIITIDKSLACGRRIQSMLEVAPSMAYPLGTQAPAGAGDCAVRFDHVSFSYSKSGDAALTDIDFLNLRHALGRDNETSTNIRASFTIARTTNSNRK